MDSIEVFKNMIRIDTIFSEDKIIINVTAIKVEIIFERIEWAKLRFTHDLLSQQMFQWRPDATPYV